MTESGNARRKPALPGFYQGGLAVDSAILYITFLRDPIDRIARRIGTSFCAIVASAASKKIDLAADRVVANQQAERLLEDYGNHILRLAYSYLHNISDAEEILQDTLLQFLKKTPTFENQGHEKAWLLCVAGNLSKNRIQYNKFRATDELNEELVAEEKENLSFVWEAVRALPDRYREVIHLHYYEGYPTAQIAKILKRNESTVRSDLRRGRERLKTILKEAYDFEEI